jgi:hypothetical protein
MEVGIPCKRTIFATNVLATEAAVKGCFRGKKRAYLERRSTTTIMTEWSFEMGRPSMKSIEISVQICVGIGRG